MTTAETVPSSGDRTSDGIPPVGESRGFPLPEARERLRGWDHRLEATSVAAGIYALWEQTLREAAADRFFPLLFTRDAVDAAAEGVTRLAPGG